MLHFDLEDMGRSPHRCIDGHRCTLNALAGNADSRRGSAIYRRRFPARDSKTASGCTGLPLYLSSACYLTTELNTVRAKQIELCVAL